VKVAVVSIQKMNKFIITKLSYKITYMVGYFISVVFGIFSVLYVFNLIESADVSKISSLNVEKKFQDREKYIEEFFYSYESSIKALNSNTGFKKYINGEIPKDHIEGLFLTLKESLPYIFQVRYIDESGMEKIRVDGSSLGIEHNHDKQKSFVVEEKNLQNKLHRDYVKEFLLLEPNTIGISKIDLNQENHKIELPKKPTIRFGMRVADKDGKPKGILIYNICLTHFFEELDKTTLYYIHLIDKDGNFILNNENGHGGIVSEKYSTYTIFDEYGQKEAKNILHNDKYMGESFYSSKVSFFNDLDIKMIMDIKFDKLSNDTIKI
ncbi:MAG: cache domain-containing protein, partial [Campylobacterales bacterium]|nr:cache domain-containing protein [Campylobacterales bacterium]